MRCQKCGSEDTRKRGSYVAKGGKVQRHECKTCSVTFSKKTNGDNYRMRKAYLEKKVREMYCERMSLRGMARVLNVNVKTIVRYFLKASHKARTANLKALENRDFVTSYMQFDELETFEHTKRKPLGVMLFVRTKTGEIISAKVSKSPIRALTVGPQVRVQWNLQVNKDQVLKESLIEAKKVANIERTTIACDAYMSQVNTAKELCEEPHISIQVLKSENKRIDTTMRKLRQDISRLGRKTLSTTKKAMRLQHHLDLYINYNNLNRLAPVG